MCLVYSESKRFDRSENISRTNFECDIGLECRGRRNIDQ